jgi:hypothetical protein
MSIKYSIIENYLNKGTFNPKIIRGSRLDIKAMARNITSKTTLTEGTVHGVISALRDEIIEGLALGHVIDIDDLLTISVSLGGKFDTPDVSITTKNANLRINIKPDVALDDEVLNLTHLEKVITPPKMPLPVSVQSLSHHILNYYMPNAPLRIGGKNIDFHEDQTDEGVFCVKEDGTEYRIPYYSVTGSKRTDFTLSENLGDMTFKIRSRYGDSDALHQGEYEKIIKVMIATLFQNTVVVRHRKGAKGAATVTADLTTDGLIYKAPGDTAGAITPITEEGTYELISGCESIDNRCA